MKRLTRFRKFLLPMNRKSLLAGGWITFCFLLFTACQEDQPWLENPFSASEGKEMQLTIKMPSSFSATLTRGLTGAQESAIVNKDVMVLIFNKSNMYVRKESATSVNPQDATTTNFTVKLTPSTDATDTYNIVALANAKDIIDATNLDGKSYAEVIALLKKEITGAMFTTIGTGIPMWGETRPIEVKIGTPIPAVSLHRSVARIDVGVGTASGDNSNFVWLNPTNIPFELTEVIVARPNKGYAVIPQVGAFSTTDPIKAILPSVPAGTDKFSIEDSEMSFKYTDVTDKRYTTRSIYIPESDIIMGDAGGTDPAKHTERLAILVGGKYKGGAVTYYRIDFKTTNASNPNQKDFIDVLRNHLYQFNITSVTGDGYKTPGEAYKAASLNMTTEVEDWNEGELSDVVFDGQYYFAVSQTAVSFTPFGDERQTVTIKTNVTDFEMWEGGTIRLKANGTLTYGPTGNGYKYTLAKKGEGDVYELTIDAAKPNVGEPAMSRIENWEIVARRLKKSIEVSQQWTRYYVSVGNGESAVLLPEGTIGNPIEINVLSKKPVTVVSSGAWVNLGNTSGLSTLNPNGLYGAKLNLGVATYRLGTDGTDHRVATVTIKSAGESDIVYTVLQEAPHLTIESAVLYVLRPVAPALMKNVIEVKTNIQRADLTLSRGSGSGTGNNLIALDGSLYNVDVIRRDQRFQVHTNLAGTPPESGFNAPFKVELPSGKYGNLTSTSVNVIVAGKTPLFDLFWKQGRSFAAGRWAWTADASDNTNDYIFSWAASEVKLELESNRGLREGTHSLGGGTLTIGDGIAGEGSILKYPITYVFPTPQPTAIEDYSIGFKADLSILPSFTGEINRRFKRGFQRWTDSAAGNEMELPYMGNESAPTGIRITNNVEWSYLASPANDWMFIEAGSNKFASPTGATLKVDSRPTKPVAVASSDPDPNSKLCTETFFQWKFKQSSVIKPTVTPSKRSIDVTFKSLSATNAPGDVSPSKEKITIHQHDPRLYWVSASGSTGMPQLQLGSGTPDPIPNGGGTFLINVSTNLTAWNVMYKNLTTGNNIAASGSTPQNGFLGSTNIQTSMNIPANTTDKEITYKISLDTSQPGLTPASREITTVKQEAYLIADEGDPGQGGFYRIIVIGTGDNAKLMLTGRPSTEGAYFQYGSAIAYTGLNSPPVFASNGRTEPLTDFDVSVYNHTADGLKKGEGDPCRLLGYTQKEVIEASHSGVALDNRQWKTPTTSEFGGLPHLRPGFDLVDGVWGHWYPTGGFVPNNLRLTLAGGTPVEGGHYWTSNSAAPLQAYTMISLRTTIKSDQVTYKGFAHGIRCVRQ